MARSTPVIIWHLLKDPAARFTDLGPGYYQARLDTDRKLKNHIRLPHVHSRQIIFRSVLTAASWARHRQGASEARHPGGKKGPLSDGQGTRAPDRKLPPP